MKLLNGRIFLRSDKYLNAAFFALLCALAVLRDTALFTQPRFWAEELTVYFQAAYTGSFWASLIAPHQGYYSLWANLAGMLATVPPLEYAPLVTTVMALFIPLLIIAAIFFNESEILDTTFKKAVAGLATLVVGATGEIWLVSINSQHFLALLVFLIMIDSKHDPLKRRVMYVVVAVAGLSSVAANFLTPLFLVRYWQRRDRSDLLLFVILALTSAIQVWAIIYAIVLHRDVASQARFPGGIDVRFVVHNIFHYMFIYPLFEFKKYVGWIGAAFLLLTVFLARARLRVQWEFFAAIFLLTNLSVLSSLGMQGGPRYAYSSSVILMLQLLAYSYDLKIPRLARMISGILLAASIAFWCSQYEVSLDHFRDAHWPKWSDEVEAWRLDSSRNLQAHPMWDSQTEAGMVWATKLPPK